MPWVKEHERAALKMVKTWPAYHFACGVLYGASCCATGAGIVMFLLALTDWN